MRRLVVSVLLTACWVAPEQQQPPAQKPRVPAPSSRANALVLDWSMRVEGDRLRIDYVVRNGTASRVTITDLLQKNGRHDETAIVVQDAEDDPRTVTFTRAYVPAAWPVKMYRLILPGGTDIPPGGERRGYAYTRLPLGGESNWAAVYPIEGDRRYAVLEIGYYDDPQIDASNLRRAPLYGERGFKVLRGDRKWLPPGVEVAPVDDQIARSNGGVIRRP